MNDIPNALFGGNVGMKAAIINNIERTTSPSALTVYKEGLNRIHSEPIKEKQSEIEKKQEKNEKASSPTMVFFKAFVPTFKQIPQRLVHNKFHFVKFYFLPKL